MKAATLAILTGLLLVPLAASHAADNAEGVLVGVNSFAGLWEPLPNKWHEGGIVAPTRGENYGKLEAIRDLFPNKHERKRTTQP